MLQAQVESLSAKTATAELDRQRAKEWEQTAANAQADRRRAQEAYLGMRNELEALVGGLTEGEREKVREYRQKCLTRRKEAQQRRQAEHEAQARRRRDEMVMNLKYQSAQDVAELPAEDRRILWRELIERDDLAKHLDRLMDSGLFEPDGTPRRRPSPAPQADNSQHHQAPTPTRGPTL